MLTTEAPANTEERFPAYLLVLCSLVALILGVAIGAVGHNMVQYFCRKRKDSHGNLVEYEETAQKVKARRKCIQDDVEIPENLKAEYATRTPSFSSNLYGTKVKKIEREGPCIEVPDHLMDKNGFIYRSVEYPKEIPIYIQPANRDIPLPPYHTFVDTRKPDDVTSSSEKMYFSVADGICSRLYRTYFADEYEARAEPDYERQWYLREKGDKAFGPDGMPKHVKKRLRNADKPPVEKRRKKSSHGGGSGYGDAKERKKKTAPRKKTRDEGEEESGVRKSPPPGKKDSAYENRSIRFPAPMKKKRKKPDGDGESKPRSPKREKHGEGRDAPKSRVKKSKTEPSQEPE